jgi:uncharacterized integral membrane protein (TIGR00697 family)
LFVVPDAILHFTGLHVPVKALGLDVLILSIGVIPWPVVFLTTDLVNEYFGKAAVRKLTMLAVGMIAYSFIILFVSTRVEAWSGSPVTGEQYGAVFGQSQWIIIGSLTAFLISQFVDVILFAALKRRTGHRMLWLRATGSTVVSQLVDSFVVGYIAFVVPRLLTGNYLFKLLVAIIVTPLIYLAHGAIDRYLAGEDADTPVINGPK